MKPLRKKHALLFSRCKSSGMSCTKTGIQPPDEDRPTPEHLSMTTCKANICLHCWRAHGPGQRLLTNSQELAGRALSKRINSVPGRKKVANFRCIYYKIHFLHTATSEAQFHTAGGQGCCWFDDLKTFSRFTKEYSWDRTAHYRDQKQSKKRGNGEVYAKHMTRH